MTDKKKSKEALKWETLQLRLSAFPVDPIIYKDFNWWEKLIDKEPDEIKSRPALGQLTEIGEYNNASLISSITPKQIDWIWGIKLNKRFESDDLPSLGKFPETLEVFVPLMQKWLKLLETLPINRLALGTILIYPVSNQVEGYDKLNYLLPGVDVDGKNSLDFFYQINRPRLSASGIPELNINRLSKWNVEKKILLGGPSPSEMSPYYETFDCRLELDINTMAEYSGDLTHEKLPIILKELIELSKEISEKGEIK